MLFLKKVKAQGEEVLNIVYDWLHVYRQCVVQCER